MFIERLLNEGNAPLLEQVVKFAAQRHKLIAENVVNMNTPGYRQKDLSLEKFQKMLASRIDRRGESGPGMVSFDDISNEIETPRAGMLLHDGNNRSMEQLMSDQAKNALMHNMAIEMLRRQFKTMEMALNEKPG